MVGVWHIIPFFGYALLYRLFVVLLSLALIGASVLHATMCIVIDFAVAVVVGKRRLSRNFNIKITINIEVIITHSSTTTYKTSRDVAVVSAGGVLHLATFSMCSIQLGC